MFFVTVHSIQLVLFVRETTEPNSGFCRTAAPTGLRDGVTNTAVRQPARITAVVGKQLPGGIHLANFGNLCPIFLTCTDCLIVGQLGWLNQVVEPT